MFKKLQNLLFEDDDDVIEEEEIAAKPAPAVEATAPTPVQPAVQPAPVQPAPVPAPEPVQIPEAPSFPAIEPEEVRTPMPRIDVTQSIPVQNPKPQPQPRRTESVFREQTPSQTARPSTLGITADSRFEEKKVSTKPVSKPAKKEERAPRSSYQFQPVISPIFGVDEKDMNALKTTTTKITAAEKAKTETNITPIISPMYGRNADDVPSTIQKTVEKSNAQEKLRRDPVKLAAEDEIPEFSLDDILKVRDEEYSKPDLEDTAPINSTDNLFPDLNLNLWDEEPENAEDQTIVIQRPNK